MMYAPLSVDIEYHEMMNSTPLINISYFLCLHHILCNIPLYIRAIGFLDEPFLTPYYPLTEQLALKITTTLVGSRTLR